ncbi:MAG: peptidoglycan-binding domain-containing protein, partial [Gaiellaceae bacterium]
AWVVPEDERAGRRARRTREPIVIAGRELTTTQVALVAGSALIVLLAILAAAGVFSGGSKPAATPPPTVASTKTTTGSVTTPTTPTTPSVPAPTATLKPGDTGSAVKTLQRALKALGFSPGKIDGNYGAGTKTAVSDFQNSKELTADGVFGSKTLTAMQQALTPSTNSSGTAAQAPSATLKPGDTGTQVKLLQGALKALGYTVGTIDGNYGPGTKQALESFQSAQGLSADGVLGSKTLAALKQALAATSG